MRVRCSNISPSCGFGFSMKAHAYVCRSDGGFLLSYYWKNKNKLSLIDDSGNLIWTVHLPDYRDKLYLIDEKTMFYIDDKGNIFL